MAHGQTSPFEEGWTSDIAIFLLLTFGLSFTVYSAVIAGERGWIPYRVPRSVAVIGIIVPGIVAVMLRVRRTGSHGLRRILDQSMQTGFPRRWWLVTLGLPPLLVGATFGAYVVSGGPVTMARDLSGLRNIGPLPIIGVPLVLVVTILLAYAEELGWRGYLLPRLQQRFSALTSSLILGGFWFLWQVPLVTLPADASVGFPLWLMGISTGGLAIVYTWLFNVTEGSVLTVTLFHAGLYIWGRTVPLHPNETAETLSAVFVAGGNVVLAVMVVLAFGWKTLASYGDHEQRITPDETRWNQ